MILIDIQRILAMNMLYSLFYYDLHNIPIAIVKPEKDINWTLNQYRDNRYL